MENQFGKVEWKFIIFPSIKFVMNSFIYLHFHLSSIFCAFLCPDWNNWIEFNYFLPCPTFKCPLNSLWLFNWNVWLNFARTSPIINFQWRVESLSITFIKIYYNILSSHLHNPRESENINSMNIRSKIIQSICGLCISLESDFRCSGHESLSLQANLIHSKVFSIHIHNHWPYQFWWDLLCDVCRLGDA